MSRIALLDTSIYVGLFRTGLYKERLLQFEYLIRNSSVVLSELYRGCRTIEERDRVDELAQDFPVITPTEKVWLESGRILSQLSQKKGYLPDKLSNLHFDVLIALSARSVGALVVTANRRDFEEIKRIRDFKLLCWD